VRQFFKKLLPVDVDSDSMKNSAGSPEPGLVLVPKRNFKNAQNIGSMICLLFYRFSGGIKHGAYVPISKMWRIDLSLWSC